MSEWDFLWGLSDQELMDAMASGGTYEDWDYIERMEEEREKKAKSSKKATSKKRRTNTARKQLQGKKSSNPTT